MRDSNYLVEEYRRLMHLAAMKNHVLLSMTRKFVESTLHELLLFHGQSVDDSLNIEKLRDRLRKNPNIDFPLKRDAQVQTIQMFGNLSVHHKHQPVDSSESWDIVYPALRDYTRWLFRDVFKICEDFDKFHPMEFSDFAQYGFELHEGIFRIKDGEMNIDHDELKRYRAVMGGLFEANAKEMSQVFWFVSRFVTEQSDLNEEVRRLVLECLVISSWWAPMAGFLAFASEHDSQYFSGLKEHFESGALDMLLDAMSPEDKEINKI